MLQECLWCSCFIDRLWHPKKVARHYGKLFCMGLIEHKISSFGRSFIPHNTVTVKGQSNPVPAVPEAAAGAGSQTLQLFMEKF